MNSLNTTKNNKPPTVFDYLDVNLFLNDFYRYKKSLDPSFNHEVWSHQIGLGRTFMYLICTKRRPLTITAIEAISNYFQFSSQEKSYFVLLSKYQDKEHPELNKKIEEKIQEKLSFKEERLEQDNYIDFFKTQELTLIKMLLSFQDFKGTKENIQNYFHMNEADLNFYLEKLLKLKMIHSYYDSENNVLVYKSSNGSYKFPDTAQNLGLKHFHENSLKEATEVNKSSNRFQKMRSTIFSINQENYPKISEEIESFMNKLKNKYSCTEINGNELFKVNVQAYPVKD